MFWDNFEALCIKKGVAPNAAAKAVGVKSSGTVTGWKNGAAPRSTVLRKMADYFGVTVDELKGEESEQKEKPSTPEGDGLDERFDALLAQMNEQQRKELLEYMEFKVSKNKGGSDG